MQNRLWEIQSKLKVKSEKLNVSDIVDVLLKNRGLKTKREREEFFKPTPPFQISLKTLGLDSSDIKRAINRIDKARKSGEKVIIFGDYDADGVCATAILWECLSGLDVDVLPYIPNRFSEGYGLKVGSLEKIKAQNPNIKLVITVDNGIVANEAIDTANELGMDVIITDHHQKGKKIPKAHSIIHTDIISGAGIAWILTREITKRLNAKQPTPNTNLELAAIGTIADQLPLAGINRSIAKFGLKTLNKTKSPGLLALFREAKIQPGSMGTYEVNFIIAPRINAMGRLKHAIDSFNLLTAEDKAKAQELAYRLARVNYQRQKIVEEVVSHAKKAVEDGEWGGVMVVHHESYHEGVIGLAASRLVDIFYRPAIVVYRGERYSKASARSIPGFNIIEAIRDFDDMLLDGGGHPMAAGFTIETKKLESFAKKFEKATTPLLTGDILKKKLKIDLELNFKQLNYNLAHKIREFEPNGIGNPTPVFLSRNVDILNARTVGTEGRHLKMTLEQQDKVIDAIAFNFGELFGTLLPNNRIDVAYSLEENIWNDRVNLQLRIRDIKLSK